MTNLVRRAASRLSFGVEKYMPHSFVFVVVLTVVAYLAGLALTPAGPFEIIQEWYGGFWGFLEFAMQVTIIIVTGYGIATSPPVRRALDRLVDVPNTRAQAYLSVAVVGFAFAYLNWGLGMVVAAFYAITLALHRDDIDFGFVIAVGYVGVLPGVAGSLSITAPLLVNTPGHFLEDQIGLISLDQTLFSPFHLAMVWGAFFVTLLLVYLMRPTEANTNPVGEEELEHLIPEYDPDLGSSPSLADRANFHPVFMAVLVLMGGSFIVYLAVFEGIIDTLGLNSMNFILLITGILLHGNLLSYANAVTDGAERAGQVILQFPFYGGIQGILIGTGLATLAVETIAASATAGTYPFFVWLVTGFLNFFVPSAGGQYIVTAEILHPAAEDLGVSHPAVVSAYTVGDIWTNLLQPFWALPILGIAGLEVRDIWGYVLVAFVGYGVVTGLVALAFPMLGLV